MKGTEACLPPVAFGWGSLTFDKRCETRTTHAAVIMYVICKESGFLGRRDMWWRSSKLCWTLKFWCGSLGTDCLGSRLDALR